MTRGIDECHFVRMTIWSTVDTILVPVIGIVQCRAAFNRYCPLARLGGTILLPVWRGLQAENVAFWMYQSSKCKAIGVDGSGLPRRCFAFNSAR